MRYTKRFAGLALAVGMMIGAGTLSAADWGNTYRQDVRTDYRGVAENYATSNLRAGDRAEFNDRGRFNEPNHYRRETDTVRSRRVVPMHRDRRHDREVRRGWR